LGNDVTGLLLVNINVASHLCEPDVKIILMDKAETLKYPHTLI